MDDSSVDENSINSFDQFDSYNEEVELSDIIDEIDDGEGNSNVTSNSSSSSYQESTSVFNTDYEESRSTEDSVQPVEILEENNNDPNNNMDIERGDENIIDNIVPIIEMPVSPKPGCSRDFDLVENGQIVTPELHKQIIEIQEFLTNITYNKIRDLLNKRVNFKNELMKLFEDNDASLKRNNDGDICDTEDKKLTIQITSLDTVPMEMEEKVIDDILLKEEVLDGLTEIDGNDQKLTPPQQEQISGSAYVKNSIPISLDSSSDDEIVSLPNTIIRNGNSTNTTKLCFKGFHGQRVIQVNKKANSNINSVKATGSNDVKMRGNMYKTTVTNGALDKITMPYPVIESATRGAPATIVRAAQASTNFIVTSTNSGRIASTFVPSTSNNFKTVTSNATFTVATAAAAASAAVGNPGTSETLKHPRSPVLSGFFAVDGEPVPKIKIITEGKSSRIVPVDNLPQPPRVHRPVVNDEPRKTYAKDQNDRWNPVFQQFDYPKYHTTLKGVRRAYTEAQLRRELALTLQEEADREIAQRLNNYKHKDEGKNEYDYPIIQPVKLKLPSNYGQVKPPTPPRPERHFPTQINLPKIQIVNVDEAPAQTQLPPKEKDGYCQEIYTKLRAMFPNIKKDYIKNITPADWAPNIGHDVQFGQIVDRLLASEATWELEIPDDEPGDLIGVVGGGGGAAASSRTIDETYEQLVEIFPNADPTYLRTHAERIHNNDQLFEEFIEETFKKHDYPTREQYLSKMRITEEQLRYTKNFTVPGFLEKFPDPFKHFLDNKRQCKYEIMVFEFLKCHFNKIRVNTISKIYSDSGYNMSIAASRLAKVRSDMCSTRKGTDMPPQDINLLQEMAFVRHEKAIKEYLAEMENAEKLEFEKLKASNGLFECQCCYDTECMPSKCSTCDNGHIFCNSCIITGTDSKLGEGETHVQCFQGCGSEFSLATLQKILKPTKFSILVKKRQAAEVAAAGLEGLVACPFCHFASIPPEGDKVFKCLNPECMKESCIQCKEPNHVPLRCDEVGKADKARKYIEEKMTQALARTCYQCNKAYFKDEGCNKITCPCGAIMCYLCNKKIKDYTHFRGQGSDDMSRCPLYSDNARLNAENVRRVADEAKRELLRQDPALNIDTERLLPNMPPPSAGPHQQILQAPPRLPPNAGQAHHQRLAAQHAQFEQHYLHNRHQYR